MSAGDRPGADPAGHCRSAGDVGGSGSSGSVNRIRMARTKTFAANAGSAELNAMIKRVAPDILALLADGLPRPKAAIVEALAGRHERQDVISTLIRLSITERVVEAGGKYTLAQESAPDAG